MRANFYVRTVNALNQQLSVLSQRATMGYNTVTKFCNIGPRCHVAATNMTAM